MKTLLLLGSAVWLSACGSSSGGASDAGMQAQPTPSSAIQTPQQPSDSVPPANTQQAPTNSQLPILASAPTPSAITCAQVAAAVQSGGCQLSNSEMSECVAATAANAPCAAEWQAVFACLLHGVTCNNNNGTVNVNDACPKESDALGACLGGTVTPQQPTCTVASNCDGCADTCALCQCTAAADPSLNVNCTALCPVN